MHIQYINKIIMWELFTQKTPYYQLGSDQQKIIKYVYFQNGRPDLKDIKEHIDTQLLDMFERNWDKDRDNRREFRSIIPILEKLLKNELSK